MLRELGYPDQYIAKLRGRILSIEGDKVCKEPGLGLLRNVMEEIERLRVENETDWEKWAREQRILWKVSLDGKLQKLT